MKNQIENFLKQFPDNATSWSQATDEVRDLARSAREMILDFDSIKIEALDFMSFKTPAEWNTKGKVFILSTFNKMSNTAKQEYFNNHSYWFNK